PNKSIIQILLDQRFIDEEDLRELQSLSQQITRGPQSQAPSDHGESSEVGVQLELQQKKDRSFGNFCIRLGFATKAQVLECIQEQKQLQQKGLYVRLGELMLERGLLTLPQVEKVLEYQKKTILTCTGCKAQYNVSNYSPGTKVKCRKCATVLVVPQSLGSAKAVDSIYMEDQDSHNSLGSILPSQISSAGTSASMGQPPSLLGAGLPPLPTHETHSPSSQEGNIPPLQLNMNLDGHPTSPLKDSMDPWEYKETHIQSPSSFGAPSEPPQAPSELPPPEKQERRKGDRRSGIDRRKGQQGKWTGKERRRGERRKGDRRKEMSPEALKQKKIQKILVSLILGIC
ncbi:MAG: hypothetical protein D6785_05305, partial [Planctomycetota bacterium]